MFANCPLTSTLAVLWMHVYACTHMPVCAHFLKMSLFRVKVIRVVYTCNPSSGTWGHQEFKVILGYTVSWKLAWASGKKSKEVKRNGESHHARIL